MGPLLLMASLFVQSTDTPPPTPIELELVLSHRLSEAELESISYRLYVVANGTSMTELRSGREVPVPGASAVQYRNVGLNLSCRASQVGEHFRIHLTFERSSPGDEVSGRPTFQTFTSQSEIWATDGQSVDVVAGPDPESGARWTLQLTVRVSRR